MNFEIKNNKVGYVMKSKSVSPPQAVIYICLALAALAAVFPLVYTFANSFIGRAEFNKYYGMLESKELTGNPFHFIPNRAVLAAYYDMLIARPDYLIKLWVSVGIAAAVTAGQLIVSALGGYAFSKFRFPGRDFIFFIIIILMMMPPQVTLSPNYMVLSGLNLLGSYWSVILPGVFSAFGIFLMRQLMAAIPDSLLESAKIDGAGALRALWYVVLPNSAAGLASLAVLSFIDSWNMVEQPIVFLKDAFKYPMAVFLIQINGFEPSLGFACGILSVIAPLYLFLFFQKEMTEGISYSVIK